MEKILLDTSVLVKFFSPDEKDKKIDLLLDKIAQKKIKLILVDVALYELVSALSLSKKISSLTVFENIAAILDLEPEIISFSADLIKRGLIFMEKFNLTIYDSLFIAAAEQKKVPLLTADYKHHRKSISKNIVYYKEFNSV